LVAGGAEQGGQIVQRPGMRHVPRQHVQIGLLRAGRLAGEVQTLRPLEQPRYCRQIGVVARRRRPPVAMQFSASHVNAS
jgi:hypothetical protein